MNGAAWAAGQDGRDQEGRFDTERGGEGESEQRPPIAPRLPMARGPCEMARICWQISAHERTRPCRPNRATPGQQPVCGSDSMAQDRCGERRLASGRAGGGGLAVSASGRGLVAGRSGNFRRAGGGPVEQALGRRARRRRWPTRSLPRSAPGCHLGPGRRGSRPRIAIACPAAPLRSVSGEPGTFPGTAPSPQLECETAGGRRVTMHALGSPEQGYDFRVVWVCTSGEYDQAQRAGEELSGIPWPYSAVLRVLDESDLVTR